MADRERFAVLEGMRGLAALIVITDHVPTGLLGALLPGRYLAVDFFFMMSGFVIARAYGERLQAGWSPWAFLRVRVARLYPLYFIGALMGIAILGLTQGWSVLAHPATLIMIALTAIMAPSDPAGRFGGGVYPLNGPAWSIFFELFVNAVYAVFARWLTTPRLVALIAVSAVAFIAAGLSNGILDLGYKWANGNFWGGFPRVAFSFFVGVLMFQSNERLPRPAIPAWLCFLALMAVFMTPAPQGYRAVVELLLVMLGLPLILFGATRAHVSGVVKNLCLALGALSYGVYILQAPVIAASQIALAQAGLELPGAARVALVALVAGLLAWLLGRSIEPHARRWLAGRATKPAVGAQAN